MNVDFPPATVTLDTTELAEAVQDYLIKTQVIRAGGALKSYRVGNAVAAEFHEARAVGSPRMRLVGAMNFELLPESPQ